MDAKSEFMHEIIVRALDEMQLRSGARDPGRILDLRSDQRSNLSGINRVAPPVLLGIEVIDFCFYGKTSHVNRCQLPKPAQARAPMHA